MTPPIVITVRAPDGPGLVSDIAGAVAGAGGNIIDVGQHTDLSTTGFGCRLEVEASIERSALAEQFAALAQRRELAFEIHDSKERPRVVIACSKTLHCVSELLSRVSLGELECEIVGIVSDRTDAGEVASRYGIELTHIPVGEDRRGQEEAFSEALGRLAPDLVVLARYMRILPPEIAESWNGRMINIHHSFLPAFPGAGPYAQAHERGVKLIGATAHYVTAGLDEGPIIAQDVARVSHRDAVADLVRRGADIERSVLSTGVRLHLEHRVMVFENRTCIFD